MCLEYLLGKNIRARIAGDDNCLLLHSNGLSAVDCFYADLGYICEETGIII